MSRDKKLDIRNKIIQAAQVYRDKLAGKYFLYIYENKYIEVLFKVDNFSHLTGVVSPLSGKDFYKKSKNNQLNTGQFSFNKDHPYDLAKKKTNKLDKLSELTQSDAFIIEDMTSGSRIYKIGVTNLEFSLGLIENNNAKNNSTINNFLIPTTFRIRGEKDFDNNKKVYEINFILLKDSMFKKYDTLCFGDISKIKSISDDIKDLIDEELVCIE